MRIARPLLAALLAAPAAGCDLLNQQVPLEVPFETPPQEIDVSSKVDDIEASTCEDAASQDCLVLSAIDRSDDDQVSDPPSMPPQFPIEVDVDGDDATTEDKVNVEEWANDQGLTEAADIKFALPVDLKEFVKVESPDAIKDVTFDTVALNFADNTLTFATVPLDIYVSEGPVDGLDAEELIASGKVKKVGLLPAQPSGTNGERNIEFVEGGNAIFNTALKSLSFTMAATLPPETDPALPKNEAGDMLIKPYGKTKVSVKATVVYMVSAADIIEQAEQAQE